MPENDPLLAEVISESQSVTGAVIVANTIGSEDKDILLKNFVLWTLIRGLETNNVKIIHRIHSTWNHKDESQMILLARALMKGMIPKLGIRKLEEILTELRLGGKIDEEDNIN